MDQLRRPRALHARTDATLSGAIRPPGPRRARLGRGDKLAQYEGEPAGHLRMSVQENCYMRQHHDASRVSRFVLGLPKSSAICLVAGSIFASTGPAWSATPAHPAAAVIGVPASKASFTHSGLRTATYEIGNALDNLLFLSVGNGGLPAACC